MDRNTILAKLHKQFSSLPQNVILTIYKASECLQLLMRNNTPVDIRWLIKVKVRLARELPPKVFAHMPSYEKETIQENEGLNGSKFLVIRVPKLIAKDFHVNIWKWCLVTRKITLN